MLLVVLPSAAVRENFHFADYLVKICQAACNSLDNMTRTQNKKLSKEHLTYSINIVQLFFKVSHVFKYGCTGICMIEKCSIKLWI